MQTFLISAGDWLFHNFFNRLDKDFPNMNKNVHTNPVKSFSLKKHSPKFAKSSVEVFIRMSKEDKINVNTCAAVYIHQNNK